MYYSFSCISAPVIDLCRHCVYMYMLPHSLLCHFMTNLLYAQPLQLSYSGGVQWTSNGGVFLQFPESGQLTTTNTNITISPLTPSTLYMFKVLIITAQVEGSEVMVENTTDREVTGETPNDSENFRGCNLHMPDITVLLIYNIILTTYTSSAIMFRVYLPP